MKADAQIQTLADLCLDVSYGYTESAQAEPVGPRFLRITDIQNGVVDWPTVPYCTIDNRRLSNYLLQRGDIVVARTGNSTGENYIFNSSEQAVFASYLIRFRIDHNKANPFFVWYQLRTPRWWNFVAGSKTGSAQAGANAQVLGRFEITLPSRHEQDRIAEQLIRIDSKIAVNRRINQTLEAMAQAIFQSWFVDFDPVKAKIAAKQEGRDPLRAAMSAISGKPEAELDALQPEQYEQLAATAALFPDEMEESELGGIPRGWAPTPIGDVAEVVKGKSYSSKDLVDNDQVALVTLKSFERGGGFRMDGFKPYIGGYKAEQVVLPGDLIVAYTDVTQAAELIGKPAIVIGVDRFKTLVASLDVGIVRPLNQRVSRQFLYGLFMTDAFQSHTFAHTSGTTVLHLAKEGVPSYIFACPSEPLVSIYSVTAEAMAKEKQKLLDQNRSLAALRDTLLPKLLSGELSVEAIAPALEATR